ncbi:hypothetical protein SMGD1_0645 [Sulfurimonas gotlandica GD1]|uniref:CHAT domain-containing protein n=1 Tax=Sulfurimonas gotlandica (strain DSM 19862 / JCM 16533 / GD1) TaxID=929558 RepID=B6BKW1_SULGG|nr:CHAT domain-containing protein [Sulfurimonas gotlandica]EDZ62305.1 conserved hypothetical protein [Sulfurimonas gotlandica GD1]EHP29172.1 hypothetical protein SMGD1_0645 [Sulfurimonas gotlandica GD1]
MKGKLYIVNILFFIYVLTSSVMAFGLESSLDIKKKANYSKAYLEIEQVVIDILHTDKKTSKEANTKIEILFNKGTDLWNVFVNGGARLYADVFIYKQLSDVTVNYYVQTKQVYKSIEIYKKLILESQKYDFMEIELDTSFKLIDIYLDLGLVDLANITLANIEKIMNEYFIVDIDNIQKNDIYSLLVFYEYQKYNLKLSLLDFNINDENIQAINFDFLMKYYGYKYITPFSNIVGRRAAEGYFELYNQNNISGENYYTNSQTLFVYAKYFAITNDKKRANIAFLELQNTLQSNALGSTDPSSKKNSIYIKELRENFDFALGNTSNVVLQRIPLKFNYLSSLYSADINYHSGEIDKATEQMVEAESRFKLLVEHYKKLPSEYQYLDGVIKTKRELLTLKAIILEKESNYTQACDVYDELIISNEKIRASLPINLRKSYFRGYAKDAYLGLIRSRAKIYEKEKTKKSFDNFLVALNLLSSRQLKDLKATADIKEQNLQELQSSMSKEDLLYIIFDVGTDILIAGISKDEIFASVIPKSKELDKKLYAIKNDLVEKQIYNKVELLNIAREYINPIAKFKGIKNIHLLSDGVLSILPLDIYPLDELMLFENYSVDYLTTLNISQIDNKKSKELKLLAVADPMYDERGVDKLSDITFSKKRSADISGYFQKLPETRREVETISKNMNSSKLLLGTDAKESIIKSIPLEDYDYIHFATHGILGGEIPDMNEPALVLAKEEKEDSLLSATEISKLKLNAKLVVLSACNSGSGEYFRGEGATGIARAFKVAGSKEIIASLWPVDSLATEQLMKLFYENIAKGNSNSKSLYFAKKKLLTNSIAGENTQRGLQKKSNETKVFEAYSNPYFWSAFILIK